jgi:hypothetical protein
VAALKQMVLGGMKPVGKENRNFWTIFHYLNRQKFLPWLFFWLFLVSCGSGMNFEKSLELVLRFLTVKKVKNGQKTTFLTKFKLFFSSKSVFLSNLSLFG